MRDQFANAGPAATADIKRHDVGISFGRQHNSFGAVLHIKEFTDGPTGSPDLDRLLVGLSRLHEFLDECRYHVRAFDLERIPRTVQVGEDQMDGIKTILLLVRPALHRHHLLCEAVIDDGLVRRAVPQVIFL